MNYSSFGRYRLALFLMAAEKQSKDRLSVIVQQELEWLESQLVQLSEKPAEGVCYRGTSPSFRAKFVARFLFDSTEVASVIRSQGRPVEVHVKGSLSKEICETILAKVPRHTLVQFRENGSSTIKGSCDRACPCLSVCGGTIGFCCQAGETHHGITCRHVFSQETENHTPP